MRFIAGTVLAHIAKVNMASLKEKIEAIEKDEIVKALRDSGWIMKEAARRLGITERMIGYKIRKYHLRIKEVRWIEEYPKGVSGK